MKNFIIINGKKLVFKEFPSEKEALIYAQNYFDHSKEIILREISEVAGKFNVNFAKKSKLV